MAGKVDLKKQHKAYFTAPQNAWELCDFPEFAYLMIDGKGMPGGGAYVAALEKLYPAAFATKFFSKLELGRDYVVPPLEGLWWADDMDAYTQAGRRDEWRWTMMLMLPEWIEPLHVHAALALKAAKKPGLDFLDVRVDKLTEGLCLQTLHLGSFAEEAPKLAELHSRIIPERGLAFREGRTGLHHEIYLSDPRRTPPEKLRTVLRQPVRRS
tara:strand:- start:20700 stop:21332 length:633 start_codon:yes stop_codon:yes gene_type:complete